MKKRQNRNPNKIVSKVRPYGVRPRGKSTPVALVNLWPRNNKPSLLPPEKRKIFVDFLSRTVARPELGEKILQNVPNSLPGLRNAIEVASKQIFVSPEEKRKIAEAVLETAIAKEKKATPVDFILLANSGHELYKLYKQHPGLVNKMIKALEEHYLHYADLPHKPKFINEHVRDSAVSRIKMVLGIEVGQERKFPLGSKGANIFVKRISKGDYLVTYNKPLSA